MAVTKGNRSLKKDRNVSGIGKYLTTVRLENGKTQEEIAARLKKSKGYISRIETEDRRRDTLRGVTLVALADAYGTSVIDILENAQWFQLPLLTKLPDSMGHSDDPLLNITAEERSELIRYLTTIRSRK